LAAIAASSFVGGCLRYGASAAASINGRCLAECEQCGDGAGEVVDDVAGRGAALRPHAERVE
jgi:hypothetical protein